MAAEGLLKNELVLVIERPSFKELEVIVRRCRHLSAMDNGISSDPFVCLNFLGVKKKTAIVKKSLDPEFNESFKFKRTKQSSILNIQVYDYDRVSRHDFIGEAVVNVDVQQTGVELSIPLRDKDFFKGMSETDQDAVFPLAVSGDLFQPNCAQITTSKFICTEPRLFRDRVGLRAIQEKSGIIDFSGEPSFSFQNEKLANSHIFVIVRHKKEAKCQEIITPPLYLGECRIIEEGREIGVNVEMTLAIRDRTEYFRQLYVEVWMSSAPEIDHETSVRIAQGQKGIPISETSSCSFDVKLFSSDGQIGYLSTTLNTSTLELKEYTEIGKKYKSVDSEKRTLDLTAPLQRSLGLAKAARGYKPKYSIIIVPGLASSALEAVYSERRPAWRGARLWVDPVKIGKVAITQRFTDSVKAKTIKLVKKEEEEESKKNQGSWIEHMLVGEDGFSDPPGIRVRAIPGMAGCDFLGVQPIVKEKSYVFGPLISALRDVGYTNSNLTAATYDWRLPPMKLQERDGYFSQLRGMVETFFYMHKRPVVLLGHSMGNKCIQYFLTYILEEVGQEWVDKHVHAFMALGGPFLGAPKAVRTVVSGDNLDLDMFLTPEETKMMTTTSSSLPWLFPLQEENLPDVLARVDKDGSSKADAETKTYRMRDMVAVGASRCARYFQDYYVSDPLYLKGKKELKLKNGETLEFPPTLMPPPVKRLWCIYGTGLKTEISYYYQPTAEGCVFDSTADAVSDRETYLNPRGFHISGGIAYETKNTLQPSEGISNSGDGTVPFCSLSFPRYWKKLAKKAGLPLQVQMFEFEKAEHREMLQHPGVIEKVIELVCSLE